MEEIIKKAMWNNFFYPPEKCSYGNKKDIFKQIK